MSWAERFTNHLEQLATRDDRAALAALRRSLDGEVSSLARAAPWVAPYLPADPQKHLEDAAYLVAGLFSLHPLISGGAMPLPLALRKVASARESHSIESRFVALLASEREDLTSHLRHAVTLVRTQRLAVHWRRLLEDILNWGHPEQYVQRRWAREYWSHQETISPDNKEHAKQEQENP